MSESTLFGADGTEVVWFAELTEKMIAHLDQHELSLLCERLSNDFSDACKDYEINVMKTYVQTYTTTFEVKAESIEEAEELLEQIAKAELGYDLAHHNGGEVTEEK